MTFRLPLYMLILWAFGCNASEPSSLAGQWQGEYAGSKAVQMDLGHITTTLFGHVSMFDKDGDNTSRVLGIVRGDSVLLFFDLADNDFAYNDFTHPDFRGVISLSGNVIRGTFPLSAPVGEVTLKRQ